MRYCMDSSIDFAIAVLYTGTMSEIADIHTALRNMAAAEGTEAANLLALHVAARNREPWLLAALRYHGHGLGLASAIEICDRLAELTDPGRKET